MAIGLVGRKCGMTRIFSQNGQTIPVTIVQVEPANRITQIKTQANDGYDAIQITAGLARLNHINKPRAGQFAKAQIESPGNGLWEFRLDTPEQIKKATELGLGGEVTVTCFTPEQSVDVTSVSKGKGFAGVVKRHNFCTQDASHGNSLSHRAPGSTGQNQTPGRVFKGKKMAGQMGNKRCTVQNLRVVKVDSERNLLMILGGLPGPAGADVIVQPAVKQQTKEV